MITFNHKLQHHQDAQGHFLSKDINWEAMTDSQLQAYQNQLYSLYQDIHQNQRIHSNSFSDQQNNQQLIIKSYHFKDLFFDCLQGKNHSLKFIGSTIGTQKQQNLLNSIQRWLIHILFKIGQQEKSFYPHLLTHIKEQFYKPNIFDNLHIDNDLKTNYSSLIDIFFNEACEKLSYQQFIRQNPKFEDLCIQVFSKIVSKQKQILQHLNFKQEREKSRTGSFKLIQKICDKFFIEVQKFGYENPQIDMIAIGNEQRYIFIQESESIFLITLQKFALLNARRKSSHCISVSNKQQSENYQKKSSIKKNSWNKLEQTACFGDPNFTQNIYKDTLNLQIIQSDSTSNLDSSFLKSESKANQLSDQSTPKFKNSSIANARKKSHKDSFGGVDFDNIVYKDLSNPKKYMDQKNSKNKRNHNSPSSYFEIQKKKVLSQRFQTHEVGSLTCGQQEQSQIQFLPHFQMCDSRQNEKILPVFSNLPNSPDYSRENYAASSLFKVQNGFQESKQRLIKKMKGSNIQKTSNFYKQDQQVEQNLPSLKNKSSTKSQRNLITISSFGNKFMTTSQIIRYEGSLFNQNSLQSDEDFLIIPALNNKQNAQEYLNQGSIPLNNVLMSFSKNDKQKFIIPDTKLIQSVQVQPNDKQQANFMKKIKTWDQKQLDCNNQTNQKLRKYSYRTQKEEREKYRMKLKLQQQTSFSQTSIRFNQKQDPQNQINKHLFSYQKYHNTSQTNRPYQYGSHSQTNLKKSCNFIEVSRQNMMSKLQRKHSSNIPVYEAVESQLNGQQKLGFPQKNFVNTRQEIVKRFEQNSVRFSQVFDNENDELFYVGKSQNKKQTLGTKKQRKVTDIYEGPLTNCNKITNRTSQVVQRQYLREKLQRQKNNNFNGLLSVNDDKSNILMSSGGGKNYSVLSNVSYDEEKRLFDILQMENHAKNNDFAKIQGSDNINQESNELDFGNFQAVQRLIFKKKQQKNKLNQQLITLSIPNTNSHIQQPSNWTKKEIFYFFQSQPNIYLPPVKKVIFNPQMENPKLNYRVLRNGGKQFPNIFDELQRDLPRSSTSLYNFSSLKISNPQRQIDKQLSISHQTTKNLKSPTKQLQYTINSNNFIQSQSQIYYPSNNFKQSIQTTPHHNQLRSYQPILLNDKVKVRYQHCSDKKISYGKNGPQVKFIWRNNEQNSNQSKRMHLSTGHMI